MLVEVAGHGEDTGFEVPSLIVAAKDDLDPYPMAIQDSTRVIFFLCLVRYLFVVFRVVLIVAQLFACMLFYSGKDLFWDRISIS